VVSKEKEEYEKDLRSLREEILLQKGEKKECVEDLLNVIIELFEKNEQKVQRTEQLINANKKLAFQKEEKDKLTRDLTDANDELKVVNEKQEDYVHDLESIMFITSHQLRSPIAQILAVLNHLERLDLNAEEIDEMNGYLKKSAKTLDQVTRDLTTLIYKLGIKVKSERKK
jgi:uncharacterized protein (DUF3084 family)